MIPKLAEEIYKRSIQLKKYSSKTLLFKKHRSALEKELYAIQKLINQINCESNENTTYSLEHVELALFMNDQLAECIVLLTARCKNYRNIISKRIWGFHNLPRAFLLFDNPLKTTPSEAIEYYQSHID